MGGKIKRTGGQGVHVIGSDLRWARHFPGSTIRVVHADTGGGFAATVAPSARIAPATAGR
ncbi:hypothetical protein GCM10017600_27570 [Streptosporangium carneum]|uniref:Uncharacterized protein n=1 Tax=Streptosporangium carneum TaxID=47481 RepID=A0A9W6I0T4_9ACTN|nr:hypothetical protein GCM10017600_27570 [Streptosporangium carneum]